MSLPRRGAVASAVAAALLVGPPPASPRDAAPPRPQLIGRSVQGRPITLRRLGPPGAPRRVLVVGCVHGDECAGEAVVRLLESRAGAPAGSELLLVRTINPDGHARRTRQNAHGVDLNRNGSVGRRDLGPRGSRFYAGPRAFSEPESRAIRALILAERPQIVIWYHQPLAGIDTPERGWDGRARRYARLAGLPIVALPEYPGSLSRWTNVRVRAGSSFVVELPPGALSAAAVRRHERAVLTLSAAARTR